MTTRRAKDYRHFPPEYDDLLRRFADEGGCTLSFAEERDARHTARDLYRYREALMLVADNEPENSHVQAMCSIFRNIIVRCFGAPDPAKAARAALADNLPPVNQWHVSLELNPVVAAMRRAIEPRQDDADDDNINGASR